MYAALLELKPAAFTTHTQTRVEEKAEFCGLYGRGQGLGVWGFKGFLGFHGLGKFAGVGLFANV